MDAVLKRKEQVKAAAQHIGLKTRLSTQRDQAVGNRTGPAPEFFDDGNAVVADIAHAAEHGGQHEKQHEKPGAKAEHRKALHGG